MTNHTSIQEPRSAFLPLAPAVNLASSFYSSPPPRNTHLHKTTLPRELGDPKRSAAAVMFFPTTFQQPVGNKASSGSWLRKQTTFSSSTRHGSLNLLFPNVNIKQVCEPPFIPEQIPTCAQAGQSRGGEQRRLMSYRKYSDSRAWNKNPYRAKQNNFLNRYRGREEGPEAPAAPKTSTDQIGDKFLAQSSVPG